MNLSTPIDARAVEALRDQLLDAAGQLFEAEQHLARAYRNLDAAQPGYRTDTLPIGRSTGGGSQPERHETITADRARMALVELRHHARLALASAAAVRRIASAWSFPPLPTATLRVDPDDWCVSCIRIGKCSPRVRKDLCRWCDDFTRAEHQRPPIKLVKMHHEGRKITQQMVDDVLGRKPKKQAV